MIMKKVISELHEKYIQQTEAGAIVQLTEVLLCHLTLAVCRDGMGIDQDKTKVYISTRVIKHVYDKKPAEEYDFLVSNLHQIVKYPDLVYLNKKGKRSDFCLVKTIKNQKYLCCLEIMDDLDERVAFSVVTFYRIRKDSYLNSYELLWSWRSDTSSS